MNFIKKGLSSLLVVSLVLSMGASAVFASEEKVESQSTGGNIYFVASDEGMLNVTEGQYAEIVSGVDAKTVAEREKLTFQPSGTSHSEMNTNCTYVNASPSTARATGTWTYDSNTIASNSTVYYNKANGDNFEVASNEYLEMRVKPTKIATFDVGYSGTSYGQFTAWTDQTGQTAVIAFKDEIKVPGSYQTFIGNTNSSSLTVSGSISVLRR